MPDDSAFSAARVALRPESIPASLKSRQSWCCWRYGKPRPNGKRPKIPYQPDGTPAKSNDASTWSTFETCLKAYQRGRFAGIGVFVDGEMVGVDLDGCRDADGATPDAAEILGKFAGTYQEVSPSGAGYRIFCYGKPERSGKNDGSDKWVEVYREPSWRFLTVTGHALTPSADVTEQQPALDWLHQRYFASATSGKGNDGGGEPDTESDAANADESTPPPVFTVLSDADVIEKACRNPDVAALWRGDTSGHGGDASSADMALCGALAWWTNGDAGQVDRLFRQSGLYRDKWDSRRGESSYGARTIEKAVANCTGGYTGQTPDGGATSDGKGKHSGGGTAGADDAGTMAPEPDGTSGDDDAEIKRLAALSPLAYDRERTAAAKRLGCRGDTLDKLVRAARGEPDKATSGGGATLEFPDVEPWPDKVDGAALLNDLAASVKQFMSLPEHAAAAIALWTVNSYVVVTHGHVAPILAVTSPEKRCGKTTLLGWLYRLVDKPLLASNITAAAIFRTVDAYHPTMLIDEADSFLGETGDELRGILNSGHTRDTAYVIRVSGEELEPRRFSTWGTKAVSLIGKLEGRYSTLADRSIEIRLRRKMPTEKLMKLRHAGELHFEELARRCARYAADFGAALGKARPEIPDVLNDRAQDNWEPLLAIADKAGGVWPRLARSVALAMSGGADTSGGEGIGVQLLADLRRYFDGGKATSYPTTTLLQHLTEMDEAPWATYAKGKPMTARHLSRLLHPYGILPKNIRVGNTVPKGYDVADFADAFSRYLPDNRYNATSQSNSGYSPDSVSATQGGCSGYDDASLASQEAGCSVVADKTDETGPAGGGYRFEI